MSLWFVFCCHLVSFRNESSKALFLCQHKKRTALDTRDILLHMNREAVIELLTKRQGSRSLREFAKELGVSASYLSDVYLGHREPGPSILEPLGLNRHRSVTTEYKRKNNDK